MGFSQLFDNFEFMKLIKSAINYMSVSILTNHVWQIYCTIRIEEHLEFVCIETAPSDPSEILCQ